MTDYAKVGTLELLRQEVASYAPGRGSLVARPGRPVVGWTTPTVIYDKMRQIDTGARELNALILANSRRPSLRAAWEAWYARWTAFFRKYQGDFAKLGAIFYTDDLARQTDDFRAEYASFLATYASERDEKGLPLVQPSTPPPSPLVVPSGRPDGKSDDRLGITIPWWVWVLGGAALVGGGYFLYRSIQRSGREMAAKRRAIEEGVLPKLIGPDLAKAAAARDPGREPGPAPRAVLAPSGLYDHEHHEQDPSSDAAASDEEPHSGDD